MTLSAFGSSTPLKVEAIATPHCCRTTCFAAVWVERRRASLAAHALLLSRSAMQPVIAENLIRAENTAVTPIDEIIKCQDESRFHRTVHTLCLHVSNLYDPPGRNCGSTSLDRRASTQRAEASAPQAI